MLKTTAQVKLDAITRDNPLRVVVETQSETKIRRSKDLFGTTQHAIRHVDGSEHPIYGLKILVESAPGVWIDVMQYSRLALLSEVEAEAAQKKGK